MMCLSFSVSLKKIRVFVSNLRCDCRWLHFRKNISPDSLDHKFRPDMGYHNKFPSILRDNRIYPKRHGIWKYSKSFLLDPSLHGFSYQLLWPKYPHCTNVRPMSNTSNFSKNATFSRVERSFLSRRLCQINSLKTSHNIKFRKTSFSNTSERVAHNRWFSWHLLTYCVY